MAIRALRAASVAFVPHLYPYEPHGGTRASSVALGVSEHDVIKTLIFEMVAAPGINTLADLKGKRVGNNGAGSTTEVVARTLLKNAGLDPAKDAIQEAELSVTPLDFGKPSTDGQQVEANVAADQAANAAREEAAREAEAKAKAAANKSRTASNKAAETDAK